MINTLKRLIPHEFRQGLKRKLFYHQDMQARLANLRRAGFMPTGAVDGGAYHGEWTLQLWQVWSDCPMLLIEPQPNCHSQLAVVAAMVSGSRVEACALGKSCGVVSFTLGETNSGIRSLDSGGDDAVIEVPLKTLDSLLADSSSFSPNFLKLDLQGHELFALEGASQVLYQFEVVLLEISVLRIGEVPLFREVDRFMEAKGYQIYDIVPQYYRPLDGALWQIDAIYVKEASPLISSRQWE